MKKITRQISTVLAALAALWMIAGFPVTAHAQDRGPSMLDVRMVEARPEAGPADPRLNDIRGELQRNLPYGSFEMLERAAVSAVDGVAHLGSYTLRASGGKDACQITIEHNGKVLVQTRLRLERGKPAVVGGFANDRGHRILFVIVLK